MKLLGNFIDNFCSVKNERFLILILIKMSHFELKYILLINNYFSVAVKIKFLF